MTSSELLGFAGVIAFAATVGFFLRATVKWGAAAKQQEEMFEKARAVTLVDEEGQTITVVRTAIPEAEQNKPNDDTTKPTGS